MIQASQIIKKDLYIIFNPYIRQNRRSIELYGHRYKYFILNEKMFQNINQIIVHLKKVTPHYFDYKNTNRPNFIIFGVFFFRNSHTTT